MRSLWVVCSLVFMAGCGMVQRECSSFWAANVGGDWVIAQYKYDGTPMYCWYLQDVAIANEHNSDGIYWKDARTGHLIHLSGWYNRVQVVGGHEREKEAGELIGCK